MKTMTTKDIADRVTEIGGILETGVINILRNGHRPVCGSALRDILDFVEKLQRPDRGRNGHEENDRLQLRRRDAEKGPHGACAVKLRRLVDRRIDILQSRKEKNHVVSRPSPRDGDDDEHSRQKESVNQWIGPTLNQARNLFMMPLSAKMLFIISE